MAEIAMTGIPAKTTHFKLSLLKILPKIRLIEQVLAEARRRRVRRGLFVVLVPRETFQL
jgi:hypothetical protein